MPQLHPYQQRVVEEYLELRLRYYKLCAFVERSEVFGDLSSEEKERLYVQKHIMKSYLEVLRTRIDAFGVPDLTKDL